MSDLINRDDALMCLTGDITGMTIEQYIQMVQERLKALPSVTLYGYDPDVMMKIHNVMLAKHITAVEAINLLSNAQLLANEIYADIERTQRKALEEMFNKSIHDEWGSANGH